MPLSYSRDNTLFCKSDDYGNKESGMTTVKNTWLYLTLYNDLTDAQILPG